MKPIYEIRDTDTVVKNFNGSFCFRHSEIGRGYSRYNKILIDRCKNLEAEWVPGCSKWLFSKESEKELNDLDNIFNKNMVNVQITAKIGIEKELEVCGYIIARRTPYFSAFGAILILGNAVELKDENDACGPLLENINFITRMSKNLIEKYYAINNEYDLKIID